MPNRQSFSETVLKLVLPFLLMVVLLAGAIFFIIIPMADEHAKEHRKEFLEELTMTAWSILSYYHNLEQQNVCSLKVAQESAKNNIRELKYGKEKKQYFWIVDIRGVAHVQPYCPDLEGKNQSHLKDTEGKYFIKEFINTATKEGEGFVQYRWQLYDDPDRIKNKVSHVRSFSPWGWVIGTGVYVDDIDVHLSSFTWTVILVVLLIIILVAILYVFILKDLVLSENKKRSSFEKLLMQEEKVMALLEAIPDMILRIDREGVVLDYKEPIGFKPFIEPSDILDNKIIDTWDKKVANKVIAVIERVFVTTEHQTLIFDYPVDSKTMKIEAHFVMSSKDEILATFREITKRRK